MSLLQKVAVITGAAKGIGYACATALSKEGAKVFLVDINEDEVRKAAKKLISPFFVGDVGDKSQVDKMVKNCVDVFGQIDILISNAGIVEFSEFLDTTEEDFDKIIRVNLKGVFFVGQAVAKQMVKQGNGGVIINMSSICAVQGSKDHAGYNASKGGVSSLTKCMAISLASYGIRVNSICPTVIRTEMTKKILEDKSINEIILSRIPMGRIGETKDISSLVVFLASNNSSFITGQNLLVDGGQTALCFNVPVSTDE